MLSTTSCSTLQSDRVVEVKIPVPVKCPEPPEFDSIDDPVTRFLPGMSVDQLIKDLRASRILWRDRAKELETVLDGYRQKD